MGNYDDPFKLALEYAPDDYVQLDPDRLGRWRVFSQAGRLLGVIWIDDDEKGVGFLAGIEEQMPGTSDASLAMLNFKRAMKSQGYPAPMVYEAMQLTPNVSLGDEQTGRLKEAMALAQTLKSSGITAAVEPLPPVNYHVAFSADSGNEEFLDLIRSDVAGLSVFEQGAWHLLPDNDETRQYVESMEWITVAREGLKFVMDLLYRRQIPTREQVLPYSTDE